ncbi:unnamed protein product [Nezara viridula]|uniref:Uncharacterized protein n=1 Tax=Nezara viridula TaxID=85310 RepID=A0A9P0E6Z9_NEZVI|nr:unnamed protein product [Nezara viridula]
MHLSFDDDKTSGLTLPRRQTTIVARIPGEEALCPSYFAKGPHCCSVVREQPPVITTATKGPAHRLVAARAFSLCRPASSKINLCSSFRYEGSLFPAMSSMLPGTSASCLRIRRPLYSWSMAMSGSYRRWVLEIYPKNAQVNLAEYFVVIRLSPTLHTVSFAKLSFLGELMIPSGDVSTWHQPFDTSTRDN